jgi:hypothetical protein
LNGTSHSLPQSAQTALCISFSDIYSFQLLTILCAKNHFLHVAFIHRIVAYKNCL